MKDFYIQKATPAEVEAIGASWGIHRRFFPIYETDKRLRRRITLRMLGLGDRRDYSSRPAGIGFWSWLWWRINMWVN